MDDFPTITVSPATWAIADADMDETLASMASDDPSQFRPLSEFVAEVRAKIAAGEAL